MAIRRKQQQVACVAWFMRAAHSVGHAPPDGGPAVPVFATGAILVHFAEKTGRFPSAGLRERTSVLEWLMWQVAG